jgi:hypothetical protein
MVLSAHDHNLKIDTNTAHVAGKPARSRNWFIREALCQKAGDHVQEEMFPLDAFPAPFDEEMHVEDPIGKEHQKLLHVDQWKGAHQQADNIDLFHEAEMEASTPLSLGGASADSLEFVFCQEHLKSADDH